MRRFAILARWAAHALFTASSFGVGAYAFAYLYGHVRRGDPFAAQFAVSGLDVPLHFFMAGLALVLAPLQLAGWVRRRWPALHRAAGWLYLSAILVGGASGLSLAFDAQGGPVARAGFFTLALVWPLVTARGVQLAVARDYAGHRAWMCRSIAITFAAVTLRVMLAAGAMLELPFMTVYTTAAWTSWLFNLAVCEWLLRRPGSGLRAGIPPTQDRHRAIPGGSRDRATAGTGG